MHPMLRTLWLAIYHYRRPLGRAGPGGHPLSVLLGLGLLLGGCNNSGNEGRLTPQSGPTPALERDAVDNLLTLYRTALRQADIDRIDALLQPAALSAPTDAIVTQRAQQAEDGAATDVQALRATLTTTFHTRTVTALDILVDTIQVAPDGRSVTFLEVESTEDLVTLVQQTRLFRTTWGLTQDEADGTVTMRIGAVQREGPLMQVTTPGQVQAGALTRVKVQGAGALFALTGVEVTVPETGVEQALMATDDAWAGVVTPPPQPSPQPLRVQLHGAGGEALVLQHPYRLRVPGEGVVTRVAGTETTRVFAVTVAPDGTVWAGGDGRATLYQVPPGATRATQVGRLLAHPNGRVEAVAVDKLGRLHILVVDLDDMGVVGHGDIILDPAYPGVFCQTVNLADAAYPFRDPHGRPSASTRALAAGEGDVWLFGSDGGVARVQDSFRGEQCPAQGPTVRYDPVFRRDTSALPTNTVLAFVAEADSTLWLGTALGLTRLQEGHFTPVAFERTLTVPGDVATLEAFFQAVAQALFAAQPLTTVAVGAVSFVEQFGRPLVKEDLIFSAVAVAPGQLWVGTLGGGLRRIDGRGASPQEIRHLTQLDGLPSNLVVALAVSPDGALWAATDKGVSRLREVGDAVILTTFAALDGLALPVRDVAVDAVGTVWLATDGGLFRIVPQGGVVQGLVVDAFSHPVVGADVTLQGTPFHAVTDATGHFALANLPAGPQQLQVDGRLAVGGPFPVVLRAITVPDEGAQTLEAIVLKPPEEPRALIVVSGDGQTGTVGTTLAAPLVVAVVQAGETPVLNLSVTFTVTAGQGTLAPRQPVLTDAQGRAAVTLTLGPQAGGRQVTATAPGLASVTFTVTGIADREHVQLIEVSGNNQVGKPGQRFPEPLVVRLEDQFHNPVADAPVRAMVRFGGVHLVPPAAEPSEPRDGTTERTEMTGADGQAHFFAQVVSTVSQALVEVKAPQVAAPVRFLLKVTRLLVGDSPQALAVVDVNHDGIPDLLTANAGACNPLPFPDCDPGDVSVRLGRRDGTFEAAMHFDVGDSPQALAVVDVDRDGIPDLLTANQNSDNVSVRLGRRDGTFEAAMHFDVGDSPQALAVVDVDRDGIPDLLTANAGACGILTFFGCAPGDVSVWLGQGDGTFAAKSRVAVGAFPQALAVLDVDRDGIPDLLTANQFSTDVSVVLGQGDGTFVAKPRVAVAVGKSPQALAVVDVNDDGIRDLLTANMVSGDDAAFGNVSVLLGRGDGTFAAKPPVAVGRGPQALEVVDVNDDGIPDLLTANRNSDDVSVLLGRGDGTFGAKLPVARGDPLQALAVVDVNDDGFPDLLTANRNLGNVSVLLGRGDGTFGAKLPVAGGDSPQALAVVDVNDDSFPDLLTAYGNSNDVSVLLGQGDGTFGAKMRVAVGAWPQALAVVDVNDDGIPDLLTANGRSDNVSVLLGQGDGTFAAKPRVAVAVGVGKSPQALAVVDVNDDGIPDLLTANADSDDVSVRLGQGDGTFGAEMRFIVGQNPVAVVVVDVDRDGTLDLVTANSSDNTATILLGSGDGSFYEPVLGSP